MYPPLIAVSEYQNIDPFMPLQHHSGRVLCNGIVMFDKLKIFVLVLFGCSILSFSARAGLLEPYLQHKSFPECGDSKVLGKIVERFNWAEDKTWQRGFYLEDIERVRERVVQGERVSSIPRRYCRAHARLTNGKHPTLYYLIEGGQGFAGNGFNVEFCLRGLSRWNEEDGSCRVLNY